MKKPTFEIDTDAIRHAIAEGAKRAAQRPDSFQGKKNIYVCQKCRGHVVTVDIDNGVTPFIIGCWATDGCKGEMHSSFYRVFDQSMRADFEWYRPDETAEMTAHTLNHVRQGGLVLREAGWRR